MVICIIEPSVFFVCRECDFEPFQKYPKVSFTDGWGRGHHGQIGLDKIDLGSLGVSAWHIRIWHRMVPTASIIIYLFNSIHAHWWNLLRLETWWNIMEPNYHLVIENTKRWLSVQALSHRYPRSEVRTFCTNWEVEPAITATWARQMWIHDDSWRDKMVTLVWSNRTGDWWLETSSSHSVQLKHSRPFKLQKLQQVQNRTLNFGRVKSRT